jgi:hypothetical protein
MKPSTLPSPPKPLVLVFRDWVLIMPLIVAFFGLTILILVCWLGDGTIARLYRVDYFMPLPLYCGMAFIWVYPRLIFLGFVITVVSVMRRQLSE